jgi:hypothetical protein
MKIKSLAWVSDFAMRFHRYAKSFVISPTCGANCPVFPYFVAYKVIQQTIVVFAVAHAHREPDYWKNRKA